MWAAIQGSSGPDVPGGKEGGCHQQSGPPASSWDFRSAEARLMRMLSDQCLQPDTSLAASVTDSTFFFFFSFSTRSQRWGDPEIHTIQSQEEGVGGHGYCLLSAGSEYLTRWTGKGNVIRSHNAVSKVCRLWCLLSMAYCWIFDVTTTTKRSVYMYIFMYVCVIRDCFINLVRFIGKISIQESISSILPNSNLNPSIHFLTLHSGRG